MYQELWMITMQAAPAGRDTSSQQYTVAVAANNRSVEFMLPSYIVE
jgi:hypothetical protein